MKVTAKMAHDYIEAVDAARNAQGDVGRIGLVAIGLHAVFADVPEPCTASVCAKPLNELADKVKALRREGIITPKYVQGVELVYLQDVLDLIGAPKLPTCKNCGVVIRNAHDSVGGEYWLHVSPNGMSEYVGCNFVAEPA